MILSKKKEIETITKSISLLTAFAIPFANYAPIPVILLSLLGIASWFTKKDKKQWNKSSILILSFCLFSIIASLSAGLSFKEISRITFEIRFPLILLSLTFLFSNFTNNSVKEMLKWFALGAYSSVLLVIIIYIYSLCFEFDNIPYTFLNLRLCFYSVVNIISHRTYLCFNLLSGLIILFQICLDKNDKKSILLLVLVTLFSRFFILLSDARISLLSFSVIVFSFAVIILFKKTRRIYAISIALLFIVIMGYLLSLNARIHDLYLSFISGNIDLTSLDPRFTIWQCVENIITANDFPILGFGTGGAQQLLADEYVKIDFTSGIQDNFGIHNQYLESIVEYGYIGLILFLSICIYPFFNKGKNKIVFYLWTILLLINLAFESMISRSIGSYTIAFFLVLSGLKEDEEENHSPLPKNIMRILFCIVFIGISATSIKYILKDKKDDFSAFQRNFEKVETLPGDVPSELKGKSGFRIDKTTSSEKWRNNCSTYYRFNEYKTMENDSLYFSLYVYASPDFNGNSIKAKFEERNINAYISEYDLTRKGEWQKLSIGKRGMVGNVFYVINVEKKDAPDFSDLNGFVIFAQPNIELIKDK